MNDFVNSFKSAALSVGEMLTPILKESKFKQTGVLTPEEFVAAGNHLVHHCPTWSWCRASEGKRKDFLPVDKQFLVTKHVPCHHRCNQMDYDENFEKIIDEAGIDDGLLDEWVDTHYFDEKITASPRELPKASDTCANVDFQLVKTAQADDQTPFQADENDDDSPAVDMENFLDCSSLEEKDPNMFIFKTNEGGVPAGKEEDEMMQTRAYDIHITYDKYYQVPRFWLVGYDEQNQPLTVNQMKEDFSQEHADKTITLESHPHITNLSLATIHPCRHASVMKRLIDQFLENGKNLLVLDYLFIFLKFVQAVIPTVEYDYTRSIQF